jgi:hypothetical protein
MTLLLSGLLQAACLTVARNFCRQRTLMGRSPARSADVDKRTPVHQAQLGRRPQQAAASGGARPRSGQRGRQRRPDRDRDVLAGGSPVRLRVLLADAARLSDDGGRPTGERPDRPHHRTRSRGQYPALLSRAAAADQRRTAARRQRLRHLGGSGRDGRRAAPARRRASSPLRAAVRQPLRTPANLHAVHALCGCADGPLSLCSPISAQC